MIGSSRTGRNQRRRLMVGPYTRVGSRLGAVRLQWNLAHSRRGHLSALLLTEAVHILPTLFGSTLGKGIEKLAKIFRTTHVLLNPRNWIMQTMGAPLHMLRAGNFGAYKLADAISATKGGIGLGYRTEANEATRNMILGGGSDVSIAGDLKVSSPEYKNGVNTKYNQTGQQELKHKFANASEAFRESFQAGIN